MSPLLAGVLSLAVAGGGVALTGDARQAGPQDTALVTDEFTAASPDARRTLDPALDGSESVSLEPAAPEPPTSSTQAPEQRSADASAADPAEAPPDTPVEAPHESPAGSVAAPDPTPLTSDTSPLAAQLQAQSQAEEPAAPGLASLASAVLPPMLPDVAAQQEAFAAEQARIAALVEQRVAELKAEEEARAAEEARRANEWVMPLSKYRLSARFGQAGSLWSSGRHTGIDLSAPTGTPLVAMQDAVVVSTSYAGAYGNRTVLRLADGTELWYAHQSRIDVEAGQMVRKGDRIGAVGATGNVTGPHLHLEVRPGKNADPVDPLPIMAEHGLKP
ncbi:M23 family metallopeptidase [Aeromicrobium camelliae]|uniref:M23 family metallopeptidase n=1 Tax=Aeromicrobium camelliae TaxID=1538144 RepID=UPI0014075D6C|nr:M23 family metallopeptidase [Aeromicrobium camelliae]